MARDPQVIYDEMLTEKQSRTELDALDTPSNTGIWHAWLRLFAQFHSWIEQKWDAFKLEIQAIIDSNQFGTLLWWAKEIKSYQHGDILSFINNRYVYAVIDPSKQIIHFVSFADERGLVKIKVAKINEGRPEQLDPEEAAGLLSFVRQRRPPGTRVAVESLPADKLRTRLIVHFNAQLGLEVIRPLVEASYINYVNNIIFDGVYYTNKMIDELQAIPGVIEEQVEVIEIAAKQGTDPYVAFKSKYQAKSGYYEVDPDYPLSDTISYIGV